MAQPDRILVFIPAYRCAPQIVRVLQQFSDPDIHRRFAEILVLDNRSPDDTAEVAIGCAESLALGRCLLPAIWRTTVSADHTSPPLDTHSRMSSRMCSFCMVTTKGTFVT